MDIGCNRAICDMKCCLMQLVKTWMYALVIHGHLKHNEKHNSCFIKKWGCYSHKHTRSRIVRKGDDLSGCQEPEGGPALRDQQSYLSHSGRSDFLPRYRDKETAVMCAETWTNLKLEVRFLYRRGAMSVVQIWADISGCVVSTELSLIVSPTVDERAGKVAQRASMHLWAPAYLTLISRAGDRG